MIKDPRLVARTLMRQLGQEGWGEPNRFQTQEDEGKIPVVLDFNLNPFYIVTECYASQFICVVSCNCFNNL